MVSPYTSISSKEGFPNIPCLFRFSAFFIAFFFKKKKKGQKKAEKGRDRLGWIHQKRKKYKNNTIYFFVSFLLFL